MVPEISESDWKLFRKRLPAWQEAYMERLSREYAVLLAGPGKASDRFWKLEKRIRSDRKSVGVIAPMRRSNLYLNLIGLLSDSAITLDDLDGFSEELRRKMEYVARNMVREDAGRNAESPDIRTDLPDQAGPVRIRSAVPEDAERLLEIYAYYVKNTAVTFEYEVPSPEEFRSRISRTLEKYPYLVLESGGHILGYAYAGPFKERAAYSRSCEISIYLDRSVRGCGFGRMLHEALEKRLKEQGILNLYACIASPDMEDEYLTRDSERFHGHMGYTKAGEFHQCGYKFGRWYSMIWMEKIIGEHK